MKTTEIAPARLEALNSGIAETTHLSECLAVDFAILLKAVFPKIARVEITTVEKVLGEGISLRMRVMGDLFARKLTGEELVGLQCHGSDTVRGWACFAVVAQQGDDLDAALNALRRFADDGHFGVREWAWLAARPLIARDIEASIERLAPWTADPSERVRRFASEATRPRGVWCAHIRELKAEPQYGLPVLEPLRADPARYVQDSVGNWLNDAAKSRPDWVRSLCSRWAAEGGGPETARIIKRATRSLT
ncbi:MAG: DNA alkylation repair protein [Pseudomonadota bacterium]